MKNKIISLLLLLMAAAGAFTSCKKNKNGGSACDKMEFNQSASINYPKPCALAVSKSGIVATIEYNGFSAYGSNGTTTIWSNYTDFLEHKTPLQTFLSRGAEAAVFDAAENLYIAETEGTAGIQVYKKTTQAGVITYQYVKLIQGNNIPGGFINPRGIAFDNQGRLYIANDGVGNLIKVTDPMGAATVQIIAGDFGSIKGLAINGSTLYVTMYNDDRIAKCTLKPNGDFGEITGLFIVSKPVDIAVKDGLLAISSPQSGLLTVIEADKIGGGDSQYAGCKKEINTGSNTFGLAFNPLETGLFVAQLDQNKISYFKP